MTETNDSKCGCGKPATHLDAPEDSADWSCRVPPIIAAQQRVLELADLHWHTITEPARP